MEADMAGARTTKELLLRVTDLDEGRLERIRCELADKLADMKAGGEGLVDPELTDWEFETRYRGGVRPRAERPRRGPRGRCPDMEKRRRIVALARANGTLSMSAIARHVGCSEPLVAKVFGEPGKWDEWERWKEPVA